MKPNQLPTTLPSFAESRNKDAFDWWDALNNPEKYGIRLLDDMASNWVTCACGNQCSLIPRDRFGAPVDGYLAGLGSIFCYNIYAREWEMAKDTLQKIEMRSAALIADILITQ